MRRMNSPLEPGDKDYSKLAIEFRNVKAQKDHLLIQRQIKLAEDY